MKHAVHDCSEAGAGILPKYPSVEIILKPVHLILHPTINGSAGTFHQNGPSYIGQGFLRGRGAFQIYRGRLGIQFHCVILENVDYLDSVLRPVNYYWWMQNKMS